MTFDHAIKNGNNNNTEGYDNVNDVVDDLSNDVGNSIDVVSSDDLNDNDVADNDKDEDFGYDAH